MSSNTGTRRKLPAKTRRRIRDLWKRFSKNGDASLLAYIAQAAERGFDYAYSRNSDSRMLRLRGIHAGRLVEQYRADTAAGFMAAYEERIMNYNGRNGVP